MAIEFADNFTNRGNPFMLQIIGGVARSINIRQNIYPNLEFGAIGKVNAIVLHQTNSSLAISTLIAYNFRSTGAHFLIAPDGIIYQTARVNRECYHVGMIASRCMETFSCPVDEVIDDVRDKSESSKTYLSRVHNREKNKPYPKRYPTNKDSIGIEVAGTTDGEGIYQAPSQLQNFWSKWLVAELLDSFSMTRDQVFAHGKIGSTKRPSEGIKIQY